MNLPEATAKSQPVLVFVLRLRIGLADVNKREGCSKANQADNYVYKKIYTRSDCGIEHNTCF